MSSATTRAAAGRRTASVTAAPTALSAFAVSRPMPEAPPVTVARFPLRSTPSITSAAVELNPKFVVICSMNRYHLKSVRAAGGVRCADLGTVRLDPTRKRLHEVLQEFAGAIADELAVLIEELVGTTDIGFGLLHGRHVQKHERLPEMMIGAEGPDRARRAADNRTRLAVPDAASIRPGADIQRILENGRHRPIIFGRDEQNCIGGLDALAERGPLRGRRAGLQILIEKGQLADLDGFEL